MKNQNNLTAADSPFSKMLRDSVGTGLFLNTSESLFMYEYALTLNLFWVTILSSSLEQQYPQQRRI